MVSARIYHSNRAHLSCLSVSDSRDLGPTVWISLSLVTCTYVLTNVAYFSVLSPEQLLESDAVALVWVLCWLPKIVQKLIADHLHSTARNFNLQTFAAKAIGSGSIWVISIFVSLSCMGAVNGDFLSNSRYLLISFSTHLILIGTWRIFFTFNFAGTCLRLDGFGKYHKYFHLSMWNT